MVNMWFSNGTNLPMRVGLLDIIRTELKKGPHELRGREVSSRLELSRKRKPLAKAHALFYKGLKEVKGDEAMALPTKKFFEFYRRQRGFWRQNTLLKDKVLQEKDGPSSRTLFPAIVQSSVRLSLRLLSIQADERVGRPDSYLTAKRSLGN